MSLVSSPMSLVPSPMSARPSTRLRLAALSAAAVVTWLSLDGPIWPAGASAAPAPITAWWTAANLGNGVAVPGAVLGVAGKQLAVQGSNALPAVSAASQAPVSSLAVAAVRWQLPAGVTPTSLSLSIAGSVPPFVTVEACRATASFKPVYGGPYADVPSYSCANPIAGAVKGGKLTFAGIGKLAVGRTLSIVLLPGALDRVVFAPPTARSLFVTAVAPHGPGPKPSVGGGPVDSSSGSDGGLSSGVPSGPLPSIPPAPNVSPAPNPSPVVAAPVPATRPVALSESLPGWRRWVAAGVIALEVLVFLVTRRSVAGEAAGGRGIGRFVAEREAPPIHL